MEKFAGLVGQGELLQKAFAYIMERRQDGIPLARLLDEAGMRFNLSPLDAEHLARLLRDETETGDKA